MPIQTTRALLDSAFEYHLESNQNDFNIFVDAFGSPTTIGVYKFYIDAGVLLSGSTTSAIALRTGVFPAGSTLTIINNGGDVEGRGGAGGSPGAPTGSPGGAGGPAFQADMLVQIANHGTFAGGGGGGGGGGRANTNEKEVCSYESHTPPGAGGTGAGAGAAATAGGTGVGYGNGAGGNGGALGTIGNSGGSGAGDITCPGADGGAGGAAGNYSQNDSNVTWLVEGTRLGGTT